MQSILTGTKGACVATARELPEAAWGSSFAVNCGDESRLKPGHPQHRRVGPGPCSTLNRKHNARNFTAFFADGDPSGPRSRGRNNLT